MPSVKLGASPSSLCTCVLCCLIVSARLAIQYTLLHLLSVTENLASSDHCTFLHISRSNSWYFLWTLFFFLGDWLWFLMGTITVKVQPVMGEQLHAPHRPYQTAFNSCAVRQGLADTCFPISFWVLQLINVGIPDLEHEICRSFPPSSRNCLRSF